MVFCGPSLMAWGCASGPRRLPQPRQPPGAGERRPVVTRSPVWGPWLGCREQGSGLWWILAARCPQYELISICKQAVGRGERSFILLFDGYYFVIFSINVVLTHFRKKKESANTKKLKKRNYKIPIIFPPTIRKCGARQTFYSYWMNLFP